MNDPACWLRLPSEMPVLCLVFRFFGVSNCMRHSAVPNAAKCCQLSFSKTKEASCSARGRDYISAAANHNLKWSLTKVYGSNSLNCVVRIDGFYKINQINKAENNKQSWFIPGFIQATQQVRSCSEWTLQWYCLQQWMQDGIENKSMLKTKCVRNMWQTLSRTDSKQGSPFHCQTQHHSIFEEMVGN